MPFCSCENDLDRGLVEFCGPNLGGIVKAYVADYCKITGVTVSATQSVVQSIGLTGSFYEFSFREDTSSFAQTNTPTLSADIVDQVGTLVFQKLSTTKRNAFSLLRGKKLSVIYLDANGQYWLSGKDLGVRMTNLEQTTNADRSEDNTWVITLTARETEYAYEVPSSVFVTLPVLQ